MFIQFLSDLTWAEEPLIERNMLPGGYKSGRVTYVNYTPLFMFGNRVGVVQ